MPELSVATLLVLAELSRSVVVIHRPSRPDTYTPHLVLKS